MEGSPGLTLDQVAHAVSPGRGRDASGYGLSTKGLLRATHAAEFIIKQGIEARGGVAIASGYKTPADKSGKPWSPPRSSEIFRRGKPEAYSTADAWRKLGVGAAAIRIEPRSFNSITNLVNCEYGGRGGSRGYFPDDRPVAIVAQEKHLERFIDVIAPKVLRRDYLGIVVPEEDDGLDQDGSLYRLASQATLLGVRPNAPYIVGRTTIMARGIGA